MSKRGNTILFLIIGFLSIFIIIFCLTYKKEVIQIDENHFLKNERLCEILDVNKQTIKYFVGDIDYIEKETYVQITKKNKDSLETVIILPAGTIRFFNMPTNEEDDFAENTRIEE